MNFATINGERPLTEADVTYFKGTLGMARHERASHEYEATGLQILELPQSAYSLYFTRNLPDQARLSNADIELLVQSRRARPST